MQDITDMRGFIRCLEEMEELKTLKGADLNLEVGALTERAAEKEGPALLFSHFKGYPENFRVISNVFRTCKRTAPAMGLPTDLKGVDFLYAWRRKLAAFKPVPVEQMEGGPIFENQMAENEVDLYKFPTPTWHELDGGPYLGTGCGVVTKDPETGKINIGTYRVMIQSKDKVSVKMNMGKHGRLAFERSRAAGKPLPVAITLGQGPSVFLAAQMPLPPDVNEYEFAGFLQGSPVPVVRGAVTGLPIPANAEVVLEGELPPMKDEEMPREVVAVAGVTAVDVREAPAFGCHRRGGRNAQRRPDDCMARAHFPGGNTVDSGDGRDCDGSDAANSDQGDLSDETKAWRQCACWHMVPRTRCDYAVSLNARLGNAKFRKLVLLLRRISQSRIHSHASPAHKA